MKVAFLDRDGVLNQDNGYVHRVEDFTWMDGCINGLQNLTILGFELIVVTNQSGIGRGYYTESQYQHLTQWYREALHQKGIELLDVLHCPHTPEDGCNCRKPKPGLFQQALRLHPRIDVKSSVMIGDKLSDLSAAHLAGLERLYWLTQFGNKSQAAFDIHTVHNWVQVLNQINVTNPVKSKS